MIVNRMNGESDADFAKRVASARTAVGFWNSPADWMNPSPVSSEDRAFCPTGDGGGVDNSCGGGEGSVASKHTSTKSKSSKEPKSSSVAKEVKDIERLIKSGAHPDKISNAVRDAIVGKSGWFSGYTPGKVSPAEMCKALGVKVQNVDQLDELMSKSWDHERRGIADVIAQIAVASSDDPSGLKGAPIRIDTASSAAKDTGLAAWELNSTSAFYMPSTDTIHILAGTVDMTPGAIEAMYESGYDSTPEFSHVVIHENAHREHFLAAGKAAGLTPPGKGSSMKEKEKFSRELNRFVYERLRKALTADKEWLGRCEEKVKKVSFYATTDPFEVVAEYTAAVRLGYADNDRDLDRLCREMYAPVPKRARS